MTKIWRHHQDECPNCGSSTLIETELELQEGWGYDMDSMKCAECEATGYWTVYDEDDAYSNWPGWD